MPIRLTEAMSEAAHAYAAREVRRGVERERAIAEGARLARLNLLGSDGKRKKPVSKGLLSSLHKHGPPASWDTAPPNRPALEAAWDALDDATKARIRAEHRGV